MSCTLPYIDYTVHIHTHTCVEVYVQYVQHQQSPPHTCRYVILNHRRSRSFFKPITDNNLVPRKDKRQEKDRDYKTPCIDQRRSRVSVNTTSQVLSHFPPPPTLHACTTPSYPPTYPTRVCTGCYALHPPYYNLVLLILSSGLPPPPVLDRGVHISC